MRAIGKRVVAAVAALAAVAGTAGLSAPPGGTRVLAFGAGDYCGGRCSDILPPGSNGTTDFLEFLNYLSTGARPAHSDDQVQKYASLIANSGSLTDGTISDFYDDASFGVPAGQIEREYSPRADVTVIRDKSTGVPHVYGTTRSGTMFGAGYVGAEDRLFLMDVLRHVARGQLTSFAGGSPANQAFEQSAWANAPYTEADLQKMFDETVARNGAQGQQAKADVESYVAGVNAYIAQAFAGLTKMPVEYALLGKFGPQPWTVADVVATGSLVGGVFGRGGGGEIGSVQVLQAAQAKFGTSLGKNVWQAFRSANDPEAPTTVARGDFPYGEPPQHPQGVAIPDAGSVVAQPEVTDVTGAAAKTSKAAPVESEIAAIANTVLSGRTDMSNALLVSGKHTVDGHPIAVFGPQTGYFAPQLLMQEELQGPGISARGAAFAGANFYVMLGRGQDYAWSATSAGQDITDTFALPLCNTDGTPPTLQSMAYEYQGKCTPIEVLSQHDAWTPTLADQTPAGSYTLVMQRTELGLVADRGTVGGVPVIFTRLRSTYWHEVDSAIGFMEFNDPNSITGPVAFQHAANKVNFTFNWFYVDSKHTAYFNSGWNPVRGRNTDPNMPIWGRTPFLWRDYDPATGLADYTPFDQHPRVIDQDVITSWNNKQAKAYSAADDQWGYGPIYRSQLLDQQIGAAIAGGRRITRADLVKAMAGAATADLRGDFVLPDILRVIDAGGPVTDPQLAADVTALRAWASGGAHRIAAPGTSVYTDTAAIKLMDAWWPLLVQGEFEPSLGSSLYGSITDVIGLDNPPGAQGSAFQDGWYGYVSKDLRTLLGDRVAGRYPMVFCGGGSLTDCRSMLLSTLKQADAEPATQLYRTPGCADGDQFCHDQIAPDRLGAVAQDRMEWLNRPTYQQAVSFPRHR